MSLFPYQRRGRLGPGPQVPIPANVRAVYGGDAMVDTDSSPAPIAASQPGALAPELGQEVKLPGNNFPPAGAIPVDEVGDADIAPGGVATLVTFNIPATLRFRMVGIGFHTDDPAAAGFLTWSILVNGTAAPGYFGQTSAVGSIRQLSEIVLLAGNSAKVEIIANIDATAALTYRYIARIRGWLYLEKEV